MLTSNKKSPKKEYPLIDSNTPIWSFFYRGPSHTHPVRRVVAVVRDEEKYFQGYELREGAESRPMHRAPIKSYRKTRVARIRQIDARRVMRRDAKPTQLNHTTLRRHSLMDLLRRGA